jgi:hypothetical protein
MVEAGEQCRRCRHFGGMAPLGASSNGDGFLVPTCDAFPRVIPAPIWRGYSDHSVPYPGDCGIRFEPARR